MTIGIGGWGSRRKPMSIVRAHRAAPTCKDLTHRLATAAPTSACCARPARCSKVVYAFVLARLDRARAALPQRAPVGRGQHARARRGHVPARPAGRGVAGAVPADPRRPRLRRRCDRQPEIAHGRVAVRRRRGARRDARAAPRRRAHPHAPRRPAAATGSTSTSTRTSTTSCAWPRTRRFMSVEQHRRRPRSSCATGRCRRIRINRLMTDGVVETPHGAHFTECVPDYPATRRSRRSTPRAPRRPRRGRRGRRSTSTCGDHAEYRKAVGL